MGIAESMNSCLILVLGDDVAIRVYVPLGVPPPSPVLKLLQAQLKHNELKQSVPETMTKGAEVEGLKASQRVEDGGSHFSN